MHDLISWYNRNRRKLGIAVISIIVIGSIVWRLINAVNVDRNYSIQQKNGSNADENPFNEITMQSQKSAITGKKITTESKAISVIDKFVSLCNSGNINEAYNLLSDECREEVYPQITAFQKKYYNTIFGKGKRNVSIENWIDNIFMVKYYEDVLATGNVSDKNTVLDYITIKTDKEGQYKLNINSYIGRTEIDKSSSSENVQIRVVRKDIYFEYEIYTFEVTNNTENNIAIGDKDNDNSTYLKDGNDIKYTAYMNEIAQEDLVVYAKQSRTIKIKYFNEYNSTRRIKELSFSSIILDYNAFSGYKYGDHYSTTEISFS